MAAFFEGLSAASLPFDVQIRAPIMKP